MPLTPFYRLTRVEDLIETRSLETQGRADGALARSRSARALLARPGAGQVRLRIDVVDARTMTAAATIDAVGADAVGFAPGDRVAYLLEPAARRTTSEAVPAAHDATTSGPAPGDLRIVDVDGLVGIPRGVSLTQAAAFLVPGLSARTLVKGLSTVGRGHTVVVLGANAPVGAMSAAWARSLGAVVLDTSLASGYSGRIDAVLDARDTARLARRWTGGQLAQAAADVFQATRDGVFDDAKVGAIVAA